MVARSTYCMRREWASSSAFCSEVRCIWEGRSRGWTSIRKYSSMRCFLPWSSREDTTSRRKTSGRTSSTSSSMDSSAPSLPSESSSDSPASLTNSTWSSYSDPKATLKNYKLRSSSSTVPPFLPRTQLQHSPSSNLQSSLRYSRSSSEKAWSTMQSPLFCSKWWVGYSIKSKTKVCLSVRRWGRSLVVFYKQSFTPSLLECVQV